MRKKSKKATDFVDGLHKYVVDHPQYRKRTAGKSEVRIHAELRPLFIWYLEEYFRAAGYKDPEARAQKSFYWEGQEGSPGKVRDTTFASRNYPDFIIKKPYRLAIEYKKSGTGSIIKHGIGQSLMHTLSGDFDFVYFLFHDETPDKRVRKSVNRKVEKATIDRVWRTFNVRVKVV